ncbi:MAG: sensor histidine kinase, partial [Flavobacteriales bacterium]|nr:sensor histidine kinase [Flavobacteriales bacterium]
MIDRRNIDRWLVIGVAVLITCAMGFLSVHAWNMGQRRVDAADAELERVQQMLRMRLDGLVHELVEDLLAEAEAVQEVDSLRPSELVLRWRPLLMSHWPIMAVRLGDEQGNEVAFERTAQDFRMMLTSEGSKHGPVIMAQVPTDPTHGALDGLWISDEVNDPREQGWFSKALEEARNEPAWGLEFASDTGRTVLQLSTLIRSRRPELPYRIMAIDVDVSRSGWLETKASPLRQYGLLLLDGSGHVLEFPHGSNTFGSSAVLEEVTSAWVQERARWPFSVEQGSREYRAFVAPYILNGLTLHAGVVLDMDALTGGARTETMLVVVMILLLLLLAFLLGWLWLRKRQDDERVRRQVRRSRTQERKLAKALGEREVLNREVHHRVKNNLQI